ncbi:MAG: HNH endonuclease signature motif containing protein, partial [Acidimicrobiales bacterium]
VLDLGQRTRTPPPAMWDALVARDRCCTEPDCTTPAEWCDAHHIVHWANGGPTSLANLTLLCRRHHTALHNGQLAVTGTAPNLTWHHRANAPPHQADAAA